MSQTSSLTAWIAAAIAGLVLTAFPLLVRAADQHAIFGFVVNQVKKGDVIAVVRPNDILVPAKDLEDAGLHNLAGKREKIGDKEFVSLASLAPTITYELDLRAVELRITAQAKLLGATVVDLQKLRPPAGMVYSRTPSFFFNYGVGLSNFTQVATSGEMGISLFGNSLLDSTLSISDNGTITRGVSSLTIDDPKDLRRVIIGDLTAYSPYSMLGGTALVGGFGLSRDFGLNPYYIAGPQGGFTGAVTTPSTVEIYVNGSLVRRETLPPGVFTLQNIPFTQGAGNTRIVVRDAFGQEQEFSSPYYLYPNTLGPGVSDYNVAFGPVRENLGTSNFGYGKFVFTAGGRYGLTDWFTPGLRVEGDENVFNGGSDVTLATPLGGLALSAAVSSAAMNEGTLGAVNTVTLGKTAVALGSSGGTGSSAQVMGYAGAATFSYFGRYFGIGGSIVYESSHYANISLTPSDNRSTIQATINGSYPLSERVTIIPEVQYTKSRDNGTTDLASIIADVRLAKSLVLFVNASASLQPHIPLGTSIFTGLSYLIGSNTVLTGTYQRTDGGTASSRGNSYGAQLEQSPPLGPGLGYVLQTQEGPGFTDQHAQLMDHGNHGFYEFDYDRQGKQDSYLFNFSGSLAAAGGRLFAGPPIQGSFAVIRTPELPNVEGYLFHQAVGRTDSKGDLLVPQLVTPYYGNTFAINDQNIPVNYRIDATSEIVAPPYRGGAVVTFPVRRIRAFTGKVTVQVAGKTEIPAFGTLTMMAQGRSFSSPIGRDGAFFLDSPPTGKFPAAIDFDKGTCNFTIDVPGGTVSFVKLGTLRCVM